MTIRLRRRISAALLGRGVLRTVSRLLAGRHPYRVAAACIAISSFASETSFATEVQKPAETRNDNHYGPFGPEGRRLRERLWILPSSDHEFPLRATVFQPEEKRNPLGDVIRRPLVVINHGTSDATRMAVSMPVYYWLSRWFVEHGYVVVLPQRRGHGATAGDMAESIGTCADPDHYRSGLAAADDIEGAVEFMSAQPFVAPGEAIVVGISSGGWASLALASRNPVNVRAVINIAGGRGGRPFGMRVNAVCGEGRLVEAAREFGATARIPTLWLYAENDSYFRPDLARALASAWRVGGGAADLHVFSPYGSDGHSLADDRAGWDVWGGAVEGFLANLEKPPAAASDGALTVSENNQHNVVKSAPTIAPTIETAADGQTRAP